MLVEGSMAKMSVVSRSSCRYGDKCKFLHVTQQQPKTNVFGFGQQTGSLFQQTNTQQKSNPFGFGVQASAHSKGAASGFNQTNGFKPFENKWIRSSAAAGGAASSQPSENQSQSANHRCTDPESCRRIIAEDFEKERPLWKLTCYGHYKHLPCDIAGDVSYEELRTAAYDDARQGKGLQLIVERERNLVNSKLLEYESLLRNPYTVRPGSVQSTQNSFPGAGASTFSLSAQNNGSHSVSSFGQLGSSLNPGLNTGTSAQSNTGFGQFHNSIQTSNLFGNQSTSSGNAFGFGRQTSNQTGGNSIQTSNSLGHQSTSSGNAVVFGRQASNQTGGNSIQTSNSFGNQSMSSGNAFGFGRQTSNPTGGSLSSTNRVGLGSSGMGSQNSIPSTSAASLKIPSSASSQDPGLSIQPSSVSNGFGAVSTNHQSIDNTKSEKFSGDTTIWLKEQWEVGEVPEAAPPDEFIG